MNDTDDKTIFARSYPHLAPLADDLEQILAVIQNCNKGYGSVTFSAQGINNRGQLQVNYFDTQLRQSRKNKKIS